MTISKGWWLAGVLLLTGGCSEGNEVPKCVPGKTEACACPGGVLGLQQCLQSGSYSECDCSGGSGSDAGLSDGGGGSGDAGTISGTIGPDGGEVSIQGVRLVIPAGALSDQQKISIRMLSADAPMGYSGYSPLFSLEPNGLNFMQPATLEVNFQGDAEKAVLFLGRATGSGFVRLGGVPENEKLSSSISRLAATFAADGSNYSEAADPTCVRTRIAALNYLDSGAAALTVPVEDCQGRPIAGLTADQLVVQEDGLAVAAAQYQNLAASERHHLFVNVLIDMEASIDSQLGNLLNIVGASMTSLLEGNYAGRVQVGIQLFSGGRTIHQWQAPTLNASLLRDRLGELAAANGQYPGRDSSQSNLFEAVMAGLAELDSQREAFEDRNGGGAQTSGYLLLLSDGTDTVAVDPNATRQQVLAAAAASASKVLVLGLEGEKRDDSFFASLAGEGYIKSHAALVNRDLNAVNKRIAELGAATYVLTYCSPQSSGQHRVGLAVKGATNPSSVISQKEFSARGFTGNCNADTFTTLCQNIACGDLLCGACDDSTSACDLTSKLCVSHCMTAGVCDGSTITNPQGYQQACAASATWARCDDQCINTETNPSYSFCSMMCLDVSSDNANCGGCGLACAGEQSCAGASCIFQWSRWNMPPVAPQATNYMSDADTVTDRGTGLVWQRQVDTTKRNWQAAKAYCEQLSLGGQSNWRLPSRIELVSLVDYGRSEPALDETAFPSAPSDSFWSSSPHAGPSQSAWTINFARGTVLNTDIKTDYLVRCVR